MEPALRGGESLAITGGTARGKSTLLRLSAGMTGRTGAPLGVPGTALRSG